MILKLYTTVFIFIGLLAVIFTERSSAQEKMDTSYTMIAPPSIQKLTVHGKAPFLTLQLSGFYNVGLLDLAAKDNTSFSKLDFVEGRNFGTRYGYGVGITGKIALHKEGNMRLTISSLYNRLESNFIVGSSSDGKVGYNVFSWSLGIEDNFLPDRYFKPYVGVEIVTSLINGSAVLATDSTDFNLDINNAVRLGFGVNMGFEYAVSNDFGFNLGMRLTHANLLLRDSKPSANLNQTNLNDQYVYPQIPYSGWKQFFFVSFSGGVNFYFGMKNKKGF